MKKVLVVDDEKLILDIVKFNLVKEGYDVYIVYDGEEVLEKVVEVEFDLILFDLMLFKMDGLEVVCEVCKIYDMLIIMVIVKDFEIDKVLGLELGVDDYVIKLFFNWELVVCVKVNFCCGVMVVKELEEVVFVELMIGDLMIYLEVYMVMKWGEIIELIYCEFELFFYLVKYFG